MKLGPRTNDRASLKLVRPRALPTHMHSDVIELTSLRTQAAHRGQGYASDLMRDVCLEADVAQRFLFLCVEPEGGLGLNDLAQFYARLGFVVIQSDPLLMVRPHVAVRGMMMPMETDHGA
jgi:ribosomal protein S18 acetylase RimI-like enzyme